MYLFLDARNLLRVRLMQLDDDLEHVIAEEKKQSENYRV